MNKSLKQKILEALFDDSADPISPPSPPSIPVRPPAQNPIDPPGPPGKGSGGGIGVIGGRGNDWGQGPGQFWQLPDGRYYPTWTDDGNPNQGAPPDEWYPKPTPYIPGFSPPPYPPSGYRPSIMPNPPGKPVDIPTNPDPSKPIFFPDGHFEMPNSVRPSMRPARTTDWQRQGTD